MMPTSDMLGWAIKTGFVRYFQLLILACLLLAGAAKSAPVSATECSGKPDALGVSRVIAVDPTEHPRVGTMQYAETLPLADHEVVLTFDDGPASRYTDRILEILASECVKVTFFMVGEMAKTFPAEAKRVGAQGHTIGTHSFGHPFTFGRMTEEQAGQEIDKGIDAVGAALGNSSELAPFFRVPGFLTSRATEAALASRRLMTWSADVPADDWKKISGAEIAKRMTSRLEKKGRGILLLHDIHQHTVDALPEILKELKLKGFRVVHVVAASAQIAKTETPPDQWRLPPSKAMIAKSAEPAAVNEPPKIRDSSRKARALKRSGKLARKMAKPNGSRRKTSRISARRQANVGCRQHDPEVIRSFKPVHRRVAQTSSNGGALVDSKDNVRGVERINVDPAARRFGKRCERPRRFIASSFAESRRCSLLGSPEVKGIFEEFDSRLGGAAPRTQGVDANA